MLAAFLAVLVTGDASGSDPGGAPEPAEPTYWGDVHALFRERCAGCHSGEEPKGRLRLESFATLGEGGKRGDAIVAGNSRESLLFQMISGARKPVMPPRDEGALTGESIELVRVWIDAGAPEGARPRETVPYAGVLDPPRYARPAAVTALAFDASGQLLLVSGYREVLGYRLTRGADDAWSARLGVRLVGESERILSLERSPDGRLLAAVGGSPARFGEVQLWDLATGSLARYFRLGDDTLFAAAFSPDGERLAVGGTDRAVHVLDVGSGRELLASEVHSDWIFGLAFAQGGERLVSAGRDRTVRLSQASDGEVLATLDTQGETVFAVAASPASPLVLAAGEDRVPVLFDAAEAKEVRKLEKQPGAVLAAAFSADGALCAVAGSGGEIRVYAASDGARRAAIRGIEEWVYALAFRPDGEALAAGGYDGRVRLYALPGGEPVLEFDAAPLGEQESVRRF